MKTLANVHTILILSILGVFYFDRYFSLATVEELGMVKVMVDSTDSHIDNDLFTSIIKNNSAPSQADLTEVKNLTNELLLSEKSKALTGDTTLLSVSEKKYIHSKSISVGESLYSGKKSVVQKLYTVIEYCIFVLMILIPIGIVFFMYKSLFNN